MKPVECTGMVLAGGHSSRMGQDKASLIWKGKTLLQHACAVLQPLCAEVFVLSSRPEHRVSGTRRIADKLADRGPVAAIVSGLAEMQTDWALFHLVDMPLVNSEMLQMLQWPEEDFDGLRFCDGTRPRHFPFLCHSSAQATFQTALEQGNAGVRQVLKRLRMQMVPTDVNFETAFGHAFFNVNTPKDLERLQQGR